MAFAIASEDGEIVNGSRDILGPGSDKTDRRVARKLLPRFGQNLLRWLVVVAKQTMRVLGEAITRKACIENGDFSARTTKL